MNVDIQVDDQSLLSKRHNLGKGEYGHEKRRDVRGGEHPHHQGGPDQGVRPVVVEEEHYYRLHRRQRLRPRPAGEGGAERLPHKVRGSLSSLTFSKPQGG